ncbi:ATP/GTP-binding protein [Nocardia sp. CY41]|uniref:ATP/GTP-binding protein n=1 Tax=Nocardia sp. CY41 TaxID=2608686 RepID=UPI001F2ABA2A|nr:ATP/GTP-binding protein [Nocardia sp. CY41]
MPRRKPRSDRYADRRPTGGAPLGGVFGRTESGPDGDETYVVRTIPGTRAIKTYRCPGCDHEIPPGVAHIVAWPAYGGEDDRRHWHRGCWNGRQTRRITRRWS